MSHDGTVAIYNKIDDPMAAMVTLGTQISESGVCGGNYPALAQIMALTCFCEGLDPIQFSRKYHVIKGQLSMKSDHMYAAYLADGGKCTWINIGDDGTEARALWEYGNNKIEVGYSIDEAKQAGLVKEGSNWTKNPGSMLRARCQTKAIRIVHPAISAGIYSPEELEGVEVATNGPPPPVDTLARAQQAANMAEGQESVIETAPLSSTDILNGPTGEMSYRNKSKTTPITAEEEKTITRMYDELQTDELQTSSVMATADDTATIRYLYDHLKVPLEAQEKALVSRGVSVLRNLTHDQCTTIIDTLKTKARTLGLELEDWATDQTK